MQLPVPTGAMWTMITDVTRIGEWSPECTSARWLDRTVPGPRSGARFLARNRFPGGSTGDVTCVVTECEPDRVFAWSVMDGDGERAAEGSRWRYELAPGSLDGWTLVFHRFEHGPGQSGLREAASNDATATGRRLGELCTNMSATLAAMVGARAEVGS